MKNTINPNIPLYLGEIPLNGLTLPVEDFSCENLMKDTGFIPSVNFEESYRKIVEEFGFI